jgi:Ca2+-binding EF-hand superfamily protein
MTNPIVNAPTAGPEWFRRMDRNRDGDVSWREFLGPLAAFKNLDADGDGLITAAEAAMAGEGQTAGAR